MKSPYTIYIKSFTGTKVKLPVVPSELPEVTFGADIEDFAALKGGHYTIIGQKQMPTLSPENLLPSKPFSFSASSVKGPQVLKILKECQTKRVPMKYVVAISSGGYYINRWFAVNSYSYHVDKKNDYVISMDLTGWKKYSGWKKAAKL